jgi:hypothetical protein
MTMQTKQATTGVVAVVRAWSGAGGNSFEAASAFTAPRAISEIPAIRYATPNHGTDLSSVLGTTASSPPV